MLLLLLQVMMLRDEALLDSPEGMARPTPLGRSLEGTVRRLVCGERGQR